LDGSDHRGEALDGLQDDPREAASLYLTGWIDRRCNVLSRNNCPSIKANNTPALQHGSIRTQGAIKILNQILLLVQAILFWSVSLCINTIKTFLKINFPKK
jgi:hypothetical protein